MSVAPSYDTVSLVGVGLIGGSIGKALLDRRLARHVVGVGRRQQTLDVALRRGLITQATSDLVAGVAQAELIVVCTPVSLIAEKVLAAAAAAPSGATITDAGSTKQTVVADVERRIPARVHFVGSHPLAGNHASGPDAAAGSLFAGRRVVVTPTPRSSPEAVARVTQFWEALDAAVSLLSPQDHDAILAQTSHLPHLLASALATTTSPDWLEFTGSGWRDTTRVAAGAVELWLQIVDENRASVVAALDNFARTLDSMRIAIKQGDDAKLRELLERGKQTRDAVAN